MTNPGQRGATLDIDLPEAKALFGQGVVIGDRQVRVDGFGYAIFELTSR